MRVEFIVTDHPQGWIVRRGHTTTHRYDTREAALNAAENFARVAAERGDNAVVKLVSGGEVEAMCSFEAQRF